MSIKDALWVAPNEIEIDKLKNLKESYELSDLEAIFAINRSVDLNDFFNSKISDYINNKDLVDLQIVVNRIKKAIQNKEKIAILGDYDVDGITSTSLFIKLFKSCNIDCIYKIPNREDGYGHSMESVKNLDVDLLLMLDCGSSQDFKEISNKDICIIDHHQTSNDPNVLGFINPYRFDIDPLPQEKFKGICTAGLVFIVIFHLVEEMKLKFDFKALLDLVAMGTIGDCMELTGLNRSYVQYGLKLINLKKRDGIRFLCENLKLDRISSSSVAFYICPCINAAGRLGQSDIALRFLCNDHESYELSRTLIGLNSRRKEIEQVCLDEAMSTINVSNKKCIILENSEWHPGIVGILAGRIKEKFDLPTFVFYKKGDMWKGSARSINGMNIGTLIQDSVCKGFAKEGGGHAMAGGVSVSEDCFEKWKEFIQENAKFTKQKKKITIDAIMTMKAVYNVSLDKVAPFGMGNSAPLILVKSVLLEKTSKYNNHVRLSLNENGFRRSIFAFKCSEHEFNVGMLVDIIVRVDNIGNIDIVDISNDA
ncbi:hypothetical protein FZC35_00335 [Candidatus Cytomitobacter indipagum]|uniref:Single-stranded-DNA-specific exonuclease RecJ n=1 Tax=Candidatus Cytomitobacter indipagum TaxID=2601575 RepID=A0A5C0UDK0_9PROT|nr:DHHA1 domain-containing protein [Candidatus Cytomitobacter indipagum]QEK37837.1 hypothetical protein FZC35_00335 [Candidatus Cytomitobacter indipagum]